MNTEIRFGADLAGWHFPAMSEALAGPGGRPVVVMAHGFGGTMDSGLEPFARGLADAGLDVLTFDYSGWGHSGGTPRQTVSMSRQLADYRSAIAAARALPGVDSARTVLWGVSLAGGHVFSLAAERDDVAAVVALVPLVDGWAAGVLAAKHHAPSTLLRSTVHGIASKVGKPRMIPIVAEPGELGALTLSGAKADYLAIAGPTWRNEVDATVGLELGNHRPVKDAKRVSAPMLVQIADFDRSAPPFASLKAASKAGAQVRHYPCDHFDVLPGKDWFAPALKHQVQFLSRTLASVSG